ncbi:MAG: hypothetical protein JWM58_1647 [Rhizobium sp.]|nr:hypothetical protein [Rhizobium sp.]
MSSKSSRTTTSDTHIAPAGWLTYIVLMDKIFAAPRHPHEYADRHIDCQCALEDALVTVIDYAEAAGWSVGKITTAIIELADNIALQQCTLVDMRTLLQDMRKRRGDI